MWEKRECDFDFGHPAICIWFNSLFPRSPAPDETIYKRAVNKFQLNKQQLQNSAAPRPSHFSLHFLISLFFFIIFFPPACSPFVHLELRIPEYKRIGIYDCSTECTWIDFN